MREEDTKYYKKYIRADEKMGDHIELRNQLFNKLIYSSDGKKCLQVGVRNEKYKPHWLSVDKYDTAPYIDLNYDIQDMKELEDNSFDVIVCNAVLEHVENPWIAVKELYRVLRKGGEIWVEIPFNQSYHPSPNDYWRVTPEGMRILMGAFTTILCEYFKLEGSVLWNGVFFYGNK